MINTEIRLAISEELQKMIGQEIGNAMASANAQFATIINLLILSGVVTHEDVVAEIQRQIDHIGKPECTLSLSIMLDALQTQDGPMLSVIDGGKDE